ncbi:MAG TPA: hypothetical protein VFT95_09380 [Micromonosporaceae bacterium]|nr:hypothetical protein [Micromonosporaceae bacterium]
MVRLDGGIDVGPLARKLTAFLLARGIIAANPCRDDLWQPSAWIAGAGWLSVLQPHPEAWRDVVNNGVDVVVERRVHHPVENYEPPTCGRCGAAAEEDEHDAAIEPWIAGGEPMLTCQVCGWSALVGDWPATWPVAVGAPAVVFNNWPPLMPSFTTELRAVLGGRTQLVRSHY